MIGVVNLYKPSGMTSSQAVVKVKKILGTRAVGHMGTLDPQGEGVLLLGVGKATRLFDYFLTKDKVYEAEFTFGYETDTLDGEGTVTREGGAIPSRAATEEAIATFVGKQDQIPPRYSAKKLDGCKAYDLARSGEDFHLQPCQVEVFDFRLLDFCGDRAVVRIHCSSGTYIRSLCRDLAHKLGTYATMTAIKRTRCGAFTSDKATRLDELSASDVISVEDALTELDRVLLPDECYSRLTNGVAVECEGEGKCLAFCRGELFGIGVREGGRVKIRTYLRSE